MTGLLIARGVVGSRAYGLDHADSDTDTMEVFMSPTVSLLGLRGETDGTGVGKNEFDGDRTSHELGKFAKLAAAGNPSVLEFMFLPSYLHMHFYFARFMQVREAFLSQRMHKTYCGYARGQLDRLTKRGDGTFAADLGKRTEKHARHIARLLFQLAHAKEHGTIRVRLTEKEVADCRAVGKSAVYKLDQFINIFDQLIESVNEMPSVLPKEPDIAVINERLVQLRISEMELAGVIPLLSRHADTRTRAEDRARWIKVVEPETPEAS